MTKTRALLAFMATVTVCGQAHAVDIYQGEQLAQRWCASCHVVGTNQRQTASEAPPFISVARKPDFSVDRVAQFLLNPHPKMPNMSLSRSEAADIAAYIGALAK